MAAKAAVNNWPVRSIQVISFLAFVYAAFGYVNNAYLHWVSTFWLSNYSDRVAIAAFGVWRVARERNSYTRNRIAVLVSLTTIGYIVIPYFAGSTFFNNHLVGSTWFFAYLAIIFAFGRRADCSWYCPCVGIRDTVGDAFRASTVKGSWWWKLRHLKWVFMGSMLVYLLVVVVLRVSPDTLSFLPANSTARYIFLWWGITNGLYFASFLVVPWTGNRNYCRFMCPWGATYGVVGNRLGFFKIEADREKCIYCQLCEKECDMGVPLRKLIKKHGAIQVADCVGCGRCIQACPKGALRFVDIRDYLGFRHKFPESLKPKASVKRQEEVPASLAGDPPGEASRQH